MIPHSPLLTSYVPSFGNDITVANGTCVPMTKHGNISLFPSLSHKDVLLVSKLSNNLALVQKLTHDFMFYISFPFYLVFYDLITRRNIETINDQGGLYCLKSLGTNDYLPSPILHYF